MIETFDGGDFVLVEVQDATGVFFDLELDGGMETAVYLSHFSGNVEASTTGNEKPGDIRADFWGNQFEIADPARQANSELERSLIELPLTSGNLLKIEDRGLKDIQWLKDEGIASALNVEAIITDPEAVQVIDTIEQPETDTKFIAVWDFEKNKALNGDN